MISQGKVGFLKLPKGVNREVSVGDHESKGHLSKKVCSVRNLGEGRVVMGEKVVSTLEQASEVAMKAGLGGDNRLLGQMKLVLQKARVRSNPAEWSIVGASQVQRWSFPELDWGLARLSSSLSRGQLDNQGQGVTLMVSQLLNRLEKSSDSCGGVEWGSVDRHQASVQGGKDRVLDMTTRMIVNLSKWE
ncbi:hypothetical protein EDC04DRAFT_2603281 [Pisolithus marmoratus]|nr:hypothetical protein EDC04DRAFT_2603281 [Pisolithus marmoratus]